MALVLSYVWMVVVLCSSTVLVPVFGSGAFRLFTSLAIIWCFSPVQRQIDEPAHGWRIREGTSLAKPSHSVLSQFDLHIFSFSIGG